MNKIVYLILIIGIVSCQDRKPKIENIDTENLTQIQIDSILTEFKFQYEKPIILDSTNQILIPISTELLERKTSYSKDGYYSDDFPRYWNVLFYNRSTGKTNLLTNEKFRISEIYAKNSDNEYREKENILNGKILYEISDIDYNKDGKLNSHDPEFLFISELDGNGLQRISPKNEDLVHYEVIQKSREIIFETRRDINNDSIFNSEDEFVWYKSKIENNQWKNVEIVDSLNRKKIEKLYFEQWLKKK